VPDEFHQQNTTEIRKMLWSELVWQESRDKFEINPDPQEASERGSAMV